MRELSKQHQQYSCVIYSGSTQPSRRSRVGFVIALRVFVISVVYFSLTFDELRSAIAQPEKSDTELSHALIGTWEIKEGKKSYPFTKAFLSFNPNGTYKWVGIADLFGQQRRQDHEGKWQVVNGRLLRKMQIVSRAVPQLGYIPTGDENISLQGDVVILQSKDGHEEMRRAAIPTHLPPFLPPHWMDKFIIQTPTPEYPIEARRLYLEGEGAFRLSINEKTGSVDSIRIVKSTGHKILDEAAIRAFKTWRFKPGTMRAAGVPVRFTLTRNAHPEKPVDSLIPSQSSPLSPEVVRIQRH